MTRAVLVALVLLIAPAAAHAAEPCQDNVVIGSTDGDDVADIFAGAEGSQSVVARQSTDPAHPVTIAGAGPTFGAALALADVDGDGCSDLLVGTSASGRVDVFGGSSSGGVATTPTSTITGLANEQFGASIAVSDRGASDAPRDLWVGAPATDTVYHYVLQAGMAPQAAGQITDDDSDATFGAVLAPTTNGVLVGVPDAAPERTGAVYRINVADDGSISLGRHLSGTPHSRYGAAVAVDPRSHETIVGAPAVHDHAGAVVVYPDDRLKRGSGTRLFQGSPGVPGAQAHGDRFGTSVVFGLALGGCQEASQWAAGAPGDDVLGRKDAGTVTVVAPDPLEAQSCPGKIVRAGHGLPGRPAKHDNLGYALGLLRYRDDFDEDIYDAFAVSVPGRHLVLAHKIRLDVGAPTPITFPIPESGRAF